MVIVVKRKPMVVIPAESLKDFLTSEILRSVPLSKRMKTNTIFSFAFSSSEMVDSLSLDGRIHHFSPRSMEDFLES